MRFTYSGKEGLLNLIKTRYAVNAAKVWMKDDEIVASEGLLLTQNNNFLLSGR